LEQQKIKIPMNSSRVNQLLKFLEESPDDPFIHYALALEYKATDPEQASRLFDHLMENYPDYLPTYYQAGQFLEEQGKLEEARLRYQQGISLATLQKDTGALKELKAVLALLDDE
jgi:tetratricopeptide (TPR) repeat protein